MTLHEKMTIPDSQWFPRNLYLINNVEDNDVFLDLKVFNYDQTYFCRRNADVTFVEKPQLKIIIF